MAWRVRRSVKVGPLRFTLTNGAISASVGSPVGRISLNTRGQLRTTERIPGTGIYNTNMVNLKGARGVKAAKPAGAPTPATAPVEPSTPSPEVKPASALLAPHEFELQQHTGSLADFPAAGWFQDPLGSSQLRKWDGKHWQTDLKAADPSDGDTSLSKFPPEGWYPDPDGSATESYWVHNQWSTAHREPGDSSVTVGSHNTLTGWHLNLNAKIMLLALVVAIVLGMIDLVKKHPFLQSLSYSLVAYPAMMLFIFGLVKGINGRPTWLNLPAGKQLGWIMFIVSIALLSVAGIILPKP